MPPDASEDQPETKRRKSEVHEGSAMAMGAHAHGFDLSLVTTRPSGTPGTRAYRIHFDYDGHPMSPWHDIPLYSSGGAVNFVCEIPKWTRAKFEISTSEAGNPLKQDEKKGVLREYKWGDMLFNYGALPQTWEDPGHLEEDTGCRGDNDPLDAVEFGFRPMPCGGVAPVKVLGVLAMIDDGETDWKLLVLRCDDPLAAHVHNVDDLDRLLPGCVHALREWLRVYKVPEGKPVNSFALGERAMPRDYAMGVVAQTHHHWARTHAHAAHPRARPPAVDGAPAEHKSPSRL